MIFMAASKKKMKKRQFHFKKIKGNVYMLEDVIILMFVFVLLGIAIYFDNRDES